MNYIADRRQEEKDRRRNEILDAATSVAAAAGIGALTMDQVARRARISRTLLYVYFQDKDDLQCALCERVLALLLERFEQAQARAGTGLEQLIALGRAYPAFAAESPLHFAALSHFQAHGLSPAPAPAIVAACDAIGARLHRLMFAAIGTGQGDGSIASEAGSPQAIAMVLWGCLHGVTQLIATRSGMLAGYGLSAHSQVEQALKIFGNGLS